MQLWKISLFKLLLSLTFAAALIPAMANPNSFGFTANQPPTLEPGKSLWISLYNWGKQHTNQFTPLCLEKSFRCSVNITTNKNSTIATTYITFQFFSVQIPKTYQLTGQGWINTSQKY